MYCCARDISDLPGVRPGFLERFGRTTDTKIITEMRLIFTLISNIPANGEMQKSHGSSWKNSGKRDFPMTPFCTLFFTFHSQSGSCECGLSNKAISDSNGTFLTHKTKKKQLQGCQFDFWPFAHQLMTCKVLIVVYLEKSTKSQRNHTNWLLWAFMAATFVEMRL